jgi:hypothetical protein
MYNPSEHLQSRNAVGSIDVTRGMLILASLLQPWNALNPMEVALCGMLTVTSAVHPWNAEEPIDETGRNAVSSAVHPENALMPIDVTLLGMLIVASAPQNRNASTPIVVTPSSMLTEVEGHSWKAWVAIDVTLPGTTRWGVLHGMHCTVPLGLFAVVFASWRPNPRQLGNALTPIEVTLRGSSTLASA